MLSRIVKTDPFPYYGDNQALRSAIYQGQLLFFPPSQASQALVQSVLQVVTEVFPYSELLDLHQRYDERVIYQKMTGVRQGILADPWVLQAQHQLLESLGFLPASTVHNAISLRTVIPQAHLRPETGPTYYAHRDTWYANSHAQINFWLPLFNYPAEQTFMFYPEAFHTPIENDSQRYNYRHWKQKVGWQASKRPVVYPHNTVPIPFEPVGFDCIAGEILLFSAHQFHQTHPNSAETIRWSIEFRAVYLPDHEAGLGPQNLDDRSTGQAIEDYFSWKVASH